MEKKTLILVLLVAGLGCLVFAAVAPSVLNQYAVDSSSNVAIVDNSYQNLSLCTIKSVRIEQEQHLIVRLSVFANETDMTNDTLHVKIVSAATYNNWSIGNRPPGEVPGIVWSWITRITYPSGSTDETEVADFAIVQGRSYIFELVGNATSTTKPIPGDYKILLWNYDDTPNGTTLYYNLTIQLDHLGTTLAFWFAIIGLALVAVGAVVGVLYLRKR